jgi:hypothetical protein
MLDTMFIQISLANLSWMRWKSLQECSLLGDITLTRLPKNWKKNPEICNVIKACPFCLTINSSDGKVGNLEHLHMYCTSRHLQKVRVHCNQKIEDAIRDLYN